MNSIIHYDEFLNEAAKLIGGSINSDGSMEIAVVTQDVVGRKLFGILPKKANVEHRYRKGRYGQHWFDVDNGKRATAAMTRVLNGSVDSIREKSRRDKEREKSKIKDQKDKEKDQKKGKHK